MTNREQSSSLELPRCEGGKTREAGLTDDNLPRERRSLYFRFRYRVSNPQDLPNNMPRNFCTGFPSVSFDEVYLFIFLY